MLEPCTPADEFHRLEQLNSLDLTNTPAEWRLDLVVLTAQQLFNAEHALISLVAGPKQCFKSRVGLLVHETDRAISFCAHGLESRQPLIINDALEDDRFSENPMVIGHPNIRFYAGQPLHLDGGSALGMLCIMDAQPRSFSMHDKKVLGALGEWASLEIQKRSTVKAQLEMIEASGVHEASLVEPISSLWTHSAATSLIGSPEDGLGRKYVVLLVHVEHPSYRSNGNDHAADDLEHWLRMSVARDLRAICRDDAIPFHYKGLCFEILSAVDKIELVRDRLAKWKDEHLPALRSQHIELELSISGPYMVPAETHHNSSAVDTWLGGHWAAIGW